MATNGFPALPTLAALPDALAQSDAAKNAADNGTQSFPLPQSLPNPFDYLGGTADAVSAVEKGTASGSLFDGISFARVGAFVVGLLFVGGGILMFRQTQIVIQSGVKTGKRVAEIAAL